MTTRYDHPVDFDKFHRNLFKIKGIGDIFIFEEIHDFMLKDSNLLDMDNFLLHVNKMLKDGEAIAVSAYKIENGKSVEVPAYKLVKRIEPTEITEQKQDVILSDVVRSVDYDKFCDLISKWKVKGQFFTSYRLEEKLNSMDIFLDKLMIGVYLRDMLRDGKLIKISRKIYKKMY